jgi:hypothetical protein
MMQSANRDFERVSPDDIELIAEVLSLHPEVESQLHVLRAILRTAKFPITSADAIVDAIEGLCYHGFTLSGNEVKELLGPQFFPIDSRKQLVEDVAQLWRLLHGETYRQVSLEELINRCGDPSREQLRSAPVVVAQIPSDCDSIP